MKNKLISLSVAVAVTGTAQAVTMQLSVFGAGNQTILADSTGTAMNGMTWGILVDTTGNGFSDFSLATDNTQFSTGFFGGTDDYLFVSTNLTTAFAGASGSATQIQFNLNDDVGGGESFGLFWTDSVAEDGMMVAGSTNYGLSTDASFTVPNSNSDTVNPDALRSASPAGAADQVYGVPEPSVALLGLLGGLGLLRRRRAQ